MDLFDIWAKLSLDSKDYDEGLDKAQNKANGFGQALLSGIGGAVKTAGALTGAAVSAAATAVVSITKQAVDSYANYEQLVGGVDTLFKDASDTVQENASKAFATAGMSANEYMELVTSFSGSLIQSTGRGAQEDLYALKENLDQQYKETKRHWEDRIALVKDSSQKTNMKRQMEDELEMLKKHNAEVLAQAEANNMMSVSTAESLERAAKLADQAIIDMSDNANKMGTDIASLQNAYQGFSKQNYTMLDNLKLGYGGTRAEMERLLKDAERIAGVKFDISSYADIVEAIHVIQEEMGIAGATYEEAEKTISGSMKMVKASWQDLLTSLAGGGVSVQEAVQNLTHSVEVMLKNIIPIAQEAMRGISQLIAEIAPIIAEALPPLIEEVIPMFLDTTLKIVEALVQNLPSLIETIVSAVIDILPQLVDAFFGILDQLLTGVLPAIFEVAMQLVLALAQGLADNAENLISSVVQLITFMVDVFLENLPLIIKIGMELLLAIIEGILVNIQYVVDAIVKIVSTIIEVILENLPLFLEMGVRILAEIALGIVMAIPMLLVSLGKVLGIVEDTKNNVGRNTDEMRSMVDGTNDYTTQSMKDINQMMVRSKDNARAMFVDMNKLSDMEKDRAAQNAEEIAKISEGLNNKVSNFLIRGVEVSFERTIGSVRSFYEVFYNRIKLCIDILTEFNSMHAAPTLDPSGIIAGCNAIVDACKEAKNSIKSLSESSGYSRAYGGARAEGGEIRAGSAYLVGENGPELVTATRAGFVHNASDTARMLGSGAPSFVININGDIYDDQRSMERKMRNAIMNVIEEQVSYG